MTTMTIIILLAVFIGVTALVAGIANLLQPRPHATAEDRLSSLAQSVDQTMPNLGQQAGSLLAGSLDDHQPNPLERIVAKLVNLQGWIDQAGVNVTPTKLAVSIFALAAAGGFLATLTPLGWLLMPFGVLGGAIIPMMWLYIKRHMRLRVFEKQLPVAMELLARSLRAGHSLSDGISLIADEMSDPISTEFARVYEEQNLGILLEDALEEMTVRVPNLDLRFFVTAMVMQRQTGGDAAEVLDKIGRLIRERLSIRGQIKALTGEGRMSGIVLLSLPVVLALYMYFRNPDYLMMLATDPIGQKMVAVTVGLQILGALVIRKIVDIKV